MTYHIEGSHDRDGQVTTCDATAVGVVRRESVGRFHEDYVWSSPALGGAPDTAKLDQSVSLAREVIPEPPDFRRFDMRLVGPALDFMTFYVDVWRASKTPSLTQCRRTAHVPTPA